MSTHAIPNPKDRNRAEDMKRLARKVVTDRLSFSNEGLTDHVADSPDLLMYYVTDALGASYRVSWSEVTEEENADVCTLSKEWSDYCGDLFDGVRGFILQALN